MITNKHERKWFLIGIDIIDSFGEELLKTQIWEELLNKLSIKNKISSNSDKLNQTQIWYNESKFEIFTAQLFADE